MPSNFEQRQFRLNTHDNIRVIEKQTTNTKLVHGHGTKKAT